MRINKISINESQRKAIVESAGKDSGLTMEAVNKISDFIEQSMNAKIVAIGKALRKEAIRHYARKYKKIATEAVRRNNESKLQKIDMYLEHVVDKWNRNNSVAINTTVNSVQNKRIVEGILGLFESNYVNLPAGKENVLKDLGNYAVKLESMSISNKKKLEQARINESKLKRIALTEAAARNLTDSQREKLFEMSKQIRAKNVQEFKNKLLQLRKTISLRSNSPVRESAGGNNNQRTRIVLSESTPDKRSNSGSDLVSASRNLLSR